LRLKQQLKREWCQTDVLIVSRKFSTL